MQFNNYYFILYFLPVTVLVYYLANKINICAGKIVLILASAFFYAYGRLDMLIYLGISMLINYLSAFFIRKYSINNRIVMALPIIVNVGLLLYFKYLNFVIDNINGVLAKNIPLQNIILPLGISFYTFQQIAYVVAVERRELENINLLDYMTYILFFPKILMGPLTEPTDFIAQINDPDRKRVSVNKITSGIKIFSFGLIKKVLLADTFAKGVAWVFDNLGAATAMDCILLMLFYTFEIYFDFSGYSDMAVGVASLLNIDLPINFDSPYKAISVRDFWKRWHISLTKFLTKYIYIPLGGSRKGKIFTYVNTIVVFLVSGLWHGSSWTFVLWGLLHGVFSCFDRLIEKYEDKIFVPFRWLCTFGIVNVLWLLFSAESIAQWKYVLSNIIHMQSTAISDGLIKIFDIVESKAIINLLNLGGYAGKIRGFNMLLFTLVACIICFVPENGFRNKDKFSIGSMLLAAMAFVWGILCLGAESTFVYFGF